MIEAETRDNKLHYADHVITLEDWQFKVTGPLFEGGRGRYADTFESMNAAKHAIDERKDADRRQKKAAVTMSVPALNNKGDSVTVRGIHANTGSLLGVGESGEVYPDVPFVREALKRSEEIAKEQTAINNLVGPYRIRASRAYGRVRPQDYEGACAAFEKEFADRKAKAEAKQKEKFT